MVMNEPGYYRQPAFYKHNGNEISNPSTTHLSLIIHIAMQ